MENAAKILLIGKTGVGKSSFINYFLGKTVAKAAPGKPVTPAFISYEIEDGRYPIEIFDTKGLEALGAQEQLEEMINVIRQRNNGGDIVNWFHTIFYCVSVTNRFEDFESDFIKKLQRELTQHIHIILTHCDTAAPETVAKMRRVIAEKIGDMEHIEMFEVVCVSKKKRNGKIVEPYGKEEIQDRVFELLAEDISFRLSHDYAETLWNSLDNMADRVVWDFDEFIDKTVRLKTLFRIFKDTDRELDHLEERMDTFMEQLEEKVEEIQRETDERFTTILRPAAQLCTSYQNVVVNSYVGSAELEFSDTLEWLDTEWLAGMDENKIFRKVLPKLGRYMDENGNFPDDDISLKEIFGIVGGAAADAFTLKKRLKKLLREARWTFMYECVPSKKAMQEKAYRQVLEYMTRHMPPVYDEEQAVREAFDNMKENLKGLQEGIGELIGDMQELNQAAEKNGGKIPDVNEILWQILEGQD